VIDDMTVLRESLAEIVGRFTIVFDNQDPHDATIYGTKKRVN
jgi:hypothetical protein